MSKNSPFIAVSILVVVTLVIFISEQPTPTSSDRSTAAQNSSVNSAKTTTASARVAIPGNNNASASALPETSAITSTTASSEDSTMAASTTAAGSASTSAADASKPVPMLANLLTGLEKKVAADPQNMGLKMLLAQTYAEVGEVSRGLEILREMNKSDPDNKKVSLVYATVLGKSNNPAELNEAMALLNELEKSNPEQKGPVLLQRGRIYLRMGEAESAKKQWQQVVTELPEASGYRKQAELELSKLN